MREKSLPAARAWLESTLRSAGWRADRAEDDHHPYTRYRITRPSGVVAGHLVIRASRSGSAQVPADFGSVKGALIVKTGAEGKPVSFTTTSSLGPNPRSWAVSVDPHPVDELVREIELLFE